MKERLQSAKSQSKQSSYDCYSFDFKGLVVELHRHSVFEMVYCENGRCELQLGGKVQLMESGQMVLIGPGLVHSLQAIAGVTGANGIAVHFPKSVFPAGLLNLPEAEGVRKMISEARGGIVFRLSDSDRIRARMMGLIRSRGMFRLSRLHVLMDLISQEWNGQVVDEESLNMKGNRQAQARTSAVQRFIEVNYATIRGREAAASFLGMEANAFSRFFHENAGVSFSEYLSTVRVQKAARQLLARRGLSIPEVARQSGFGTQSAFNRQFKRRLGMTPTAYRRVADLELMAP